MLAVFGDNEVMKKTLDQARDQTPLPGWMNGICAYSLWWALIHHDYYMYTGDLDYLREQQSYMNALFDMAAGMVDGQGHEHMTGAGRFLDWPTSRDRKAVDAGLHALLLMTFDAGIRMAGALGDTALAAKCSSAAERMRKVTPDYATTKQSAALAALAGLVPARQVNEEVLKKGGVEGFSTFYGYYMLQAKAKAGDYAGAIDNIDTYWGAMLDLGATTFWEDFDIKWLDNAARIDELVPEGKVDVHRSYGDFCYKGFRHSFCHGWASGPTAWLSEHVLGISIVEPGCKAVRVRPHLGGLQWAEGTFPTPYGVISVRHERQGDGTVKSKISAPKGVKIVR
jgi:alpha-L-rhamnosidase